MSFINKYLRNFTPYKVASHKIWTVEPEKRSEFLKLDWNEATIPPSPRVIQRLQKLVNEPPFYNLYPCTYNEEILTALSLYLDMPEECLQYFASSDSLHEYVAKLYITVGDPVLLLGPTYDNFRLTAEVCGAEIFYANIGEDFVFDAAQFMEQIDKVEPSMVYICNPNNPTGTLHSIEFIRSLLDRYSQILFVVDEAYAEFTGISVKELVLKYENILVSRTMSKAFALANFRFGYLIASPNNIQYISSIRNPKNITTFTQEAVLGALEDIPYMENYVAQVNCAAQRFVTAMERFKPYIQSQYGGGNFVLLKMDSSRRKQNLMAHLAERNIYIRDLQQTEFLRERCARITVGTPEQMDKVLTAFKSFFEDAEDE